MVAGTEAQVSAAVNRSDVWHMCFFSFVSSLLCCKLYYIMLVPILAWCSRSVIVTLDLFCSVTCYRG